jgi:hypothetical protein
MFWDNILVLSSRIKKFKKKRRLVSTETVTAKTVKRSTVTPKRHCAPRDKHFS